MRWLNYQHLFYFWHVAECGSVTVAAARLRLAQPTISAQIKKFEEVLGEKLLERDGRKVKLTEVGHVAYRYAQQIFGLGQELLEVLDGKKSGSVREIKIGISDVVPKSLAYRLIAPAFDTDGEAVVTCVEDKTERLLAELAIGEVDLVIADRSIPPNVKVKAFNHFIGSCGVTFLASARVVKGLRRKFPDCLRDIPLLLPTGESAVRRELDQWFEQIGIVPRCIGAFQDRALLKIAAREGRGAIAVPAVIGQEVKKEFHLVTIGSTMEVQEQLYLISVERRLKNPLIAKLCSQAQERLFKA